MKWMGLAINIRSYSVIVGNWQYFGIDLDMMEMHHIPGVSKPCLQSKLGCAGRFKPFQDGLQEHERGLQHSSLILSNKEVFFLTRLARYATCTFKNP
jgi:hypothetical protein|uniref:Uncharacterized protein n=1 Tax=Picea glauca TaxID=3330 RepID=A0A101LW59_PICGL|nr:hypothetical protein ABT39_MTgene1568 [Picea glauca]QHR88351.1 hypothetical protein Q903MT_gene2364 [Picea sitchensis]